MNYIELICDLLPSCSTYQKHRSAALKQ